MRRKMLLIPNKDFEDKTQSICLIKTQIISQLDTYICGCQSKHSVGWNGGGILKQTQLYEYVVHCPKGYLTLIKYDFHNLEIRSLYSTKINISNATLAQMRETIELNQTPKLKLCLTYRKGI